jgi:hypothetical protein
LIEFDSDTDQASDEKRQTFTSDSPGSTLSRYCDLRRNPRLRVPEGLRHE